MKNEKEISNIAKNTFTVNDNGIYCATKEKLSTFIKILVLKTFESTQKYYENEIIVVDKTTGLPIDNCEGTIKENPKSPFEDYIYPSLSALGINFK